MNLQVCVAIRCFQERANNHSRKGLTATYFRGIPGAWMEVDIFRILSRFNASIANDESIKATVRLVEIQCVRDVLSIIRNFGLDIWDTH